MDEIADVLCLDRIYPGNSYPDMSYRIIRRSIDARKKPDICYVYSVAVLIDTDEETRILKFFENNRKDNRVRKRAQRILTDPVTEYKIPECGSDKTEHRPVIVGAGPAGLFAALLLARRGFAPILTERGESVDERTLSVDRFWKMGELNGESNVQFGEGGAGTFSDGKLTTLTKDRYGRNSFVIETFYEHGAPEDITTDAHPHIGTDILKDVVRNIREEIINRGGEVRFNTRLTDVNIQDGKLVSITLKDKWGSVETVDTDICICCIGHSARDTFEMLYDRGIVMSQKSFAMGFRVVHPQSMVNMWQYGFEDAASFGLANAEYKLANETGKGRRVYSFCMCPGGYVVNASSEDKRCCVNGMSEHDRDSGYANSAIVAAINPDDFCQDTVPDDHPLAGMYFQRTLESAAYERGKGCIPMQSFADYEKGVLSDKSSDIEGAVKGKTVSADLRNIFPEVIDEAVIESMHKFGYTMKGFDDKGIFLGIESRTSSPVRIERDDLFESSAKGLYPCGEGAGYAGGIVSAAVDGMKCAEAVISRYSNKYLKTETDNVG